MCYPLTQAERRRAEREAALTNADHIRWARETLAKFPFRNDLREFLAKAGAA